MLTCLSVAASVVLKHWRTKLRRQMNERDIVSRPCLYILSRRCMTSLQVTRGIHTDCLLNYETVKYFGGEEHEGARYRAAVREYQALEYRVISMFGLILLWFNRSLHDISLVSLNLLNLVQNFIIVIANEKCFDIALTFFHRLLAFSLDQ